jgi:hypothetical protein
MQNLQASAVPDTMVDLPMNMTPLASPVFNATGQVIGHQSALGFSPAAGFGFHGWVDTNDIFGLGKGVSLDTPGLAASTANETVGAPPGPPGSNPDSNDPDAGGIPDY